ncbi:MAG: succinylglutamate desuccinylase/aspartoacylase family protein [Gammaproteobacteria bacterium]|nr:succinylglutamate desuccinylase/aspartoacylase family protein [Gammaproteobacteria bacterium]
MTFNKTCNVSLSAFCLISLQFYSITLSFADASAEKIDSETNVTEKSSEPKAATVAPNLDLKEVAPLPEPMPESEPAPEVTEDIELENNIDQLVEDKLAAPAVSAPEEDTRDKLVILGAEVPENSSTRLSWSPRITISGLALPTPVLVINGAKPGPTVCLTAAIHGDELNGIEVVRRVMYDIDPSKLSGTLIGVPIVNLQGFQRTSRYLSDRRDLNRFFPGEPNGSLASRIAFSLFTKVIKHCNYLIDLHTGSFRRNNLPQIRANMSDPNVAEFVGAFDKIAVVHHAGSPGMLRSVANQSGIVAITMELGESLRIQENQIAAGTYSINSLLDKLDIYPRTLIWGDPKPTYYESLWLRAESGGILFSEMDLGDRVSQGDVLGIVTDPITNQSTELVSPVNGNIIGMAVNQVVIPGFAAYHIGIESTQEEMTHIKEDQIPSDVNTDGEVVDPE